MTSFNYILSVSKLLIYQLTQLGFKAIFTQRLKNITAKKLLFYDAFIYSH